MAVNVTIVSSYSGKGVKQAITDLGSFQKAAQIAGGGFAGSMKAAGAVFDSVGKNIANTGRTMTANVSLPLVAVGAGLYKATQAASDLAETQSKVAVLFGESAAEIEKFAKTAATSMGQSKQEAMDAAGTFAIFGKSAGLAGDDLVDFSTGFVGVASDMASFANTTPEQAITAIGSALRGEMEPIRKYGVLLDDASLRQEALAQGLIKTTKESLTPQQKVLASQALIYKQLGKEGSNTIGDFERTSGGLANQQRIMQAELKNTTVELGTSLLPIMLDLVTVFRDQVMPVIQGVVDKFKAMSPETQKTILIVGAIVAALGPMLMIIGNVVRAVGMLTKVLGIAGKAFMLISKLFLANPFALLIVAVLAVAYLIYKNWDQIKAFLINVWDTIKEKASALWNALKATFAAMVEGIKNFFISMKDKVVSIVAAIGSWLIQNHPLVKLYHAIRDYLPTVINFFKQIPSQLIAALGAIKGKFLEIGSNILEGIKQGFTNGWASFKTWFMDMIGSPLQWAKEKLGIASPSKEFIKIGQFITAGLAKGISNSKNVTAAMNKLNKTVLDSAKQALEKYKAKAREVLAFASDIKNQIRGSVSLGDFAGSFSAGQVPSADGIRNYLRDKLTKYKALGAKLSKLQKVGLPNAFIQDIIAAGPDGGNQLADAILGGGAGFIKELQGLDRGLNSAAAAIGNTGAASQYGMTTAQVRGVVNTNVSVQRGAVVINYGAGVSVAEKTQVKTLVEAGVAAALAKAAKEASRTRK